LAKKWTHRGKRGCLWYNMGAGKWQSAAGDVYYGACLCVCARVCVCLWVCVCVCV